MRRAVALFAASALISCAAPSAAPAPAAAPSSGGPAAAPAAQNSASTAVPAPVALRTAYTTTSASLAGVWMAKEGGYFAQNGIDADLGFVRPGAEVLAAVSSRDLPIAIGGGLEFIAAALEGSDHVMLGGMSTTLAVSLYVTPDITSVAGLRTRPSGCRASAPSRTSARRRFWRGTACARGPTWR